VDNGAGLQRLIFSLKYDRINLKARKGDGIMRIAICDDEKVFRKMLKSELNIYAKDKALDFLYDDFTDGESLLKSKSIYDLIFMDYMMGEINGVETARKLREKNDKTVIMFLSSHSQAVFESFEVNTFRFLVKPIDKKTLFKALDDYFLLYSKENFLVLTDCPKIIRLNCDDIIYVEARNKSSVIRLEDREIEYPRVLSELEKKLPADIFFKSHRSFIINFKHFKEQSGNKELVLSNGERAVLSKNNLPKFKVKYNDYLKKYIFEVD